MEIMSLVECESVCHRSEGAVDHTDDTAKAERSSSLESPDPGQDEDPEGCAKTGREGQEESAGDEKDGGASQEDEKPEREQTRVRTIPEETLDEDLEDDQKDEQEHGETSERSGENEAHEGRAASKQDGLVDLAEELKSFVGSPMDLDEAEEKMQVEEEEELPFISIVSVESKAVCFTEEKRSPASTESEPSLSSPRDVSKPSSTSEMPTAGELKGGESDLPVQTPEESGRSVTEPEKITSPPSCSSPLVKVKDEPMDEEYEKALAPQAPTPNIKDEPDASEEFGQKASEMIKISAVFSVGANSAPLESSAGSSAPPANPPPSASTSSPGPAASLCVVCSGCKKVLLKGQTAFQRKGSSQLYCSPRCLCSSATVELVTTAAPRKTCHHCHKDIPSTKDLATTKADLSGTVKDFCSQKCLRAFNCKRDCTPSALASDSSITKCSMCQKLCVTKHEVNFMGSVKKMCSNACFHHFCSSNKLTMNCCSQCGEYCYNTDGKYPTLLIDNTVKKFCSPACVSVFKRKYTPPIACTMCRVFRTLSEMVENPNSEGHRELFCSSSCATAHKVQKVSTSGAAFECNNCKQFQVPQYHLAMSDGTIRNFCSITCVVAFQGEFNKTHAPNSQLNVAPILSVPQSKPGSAESSSSSSLRVPTMTQILCSQCLRLFFSKPELLDFKGKMYAFCGKACIDEFRRTNYIMAHCVYCKLEKVVKEVKRINNLDCSFCSEGCKLLYKHDLAKRWGKKYCRSCLYCSSTSHTVVTSVFGGKQEEFCGNECLSLYALLFCEVAKCSICKSAKKMTESIKWLGEIKHFCNLHCLMYYCSLYCATASTSKADKPAAQVPITIAPATPSTVSNSNTTHSSLAMTEATPVIANVISLSNAPNGQPNVLGGAALQGAVPTVVKLIGHASTQTDGLKTPAAPQRILKNKALLCKPMSQSKGTSCKPNTSDMDTQTDEDFPKVIVLPVPVPVFVPLPMHLYTQYTPHAVGLPLPMPVPMFLPVTMDSAEQLVETIQEIKEKIPDNPLEADLIMMAEMVAEDSEKDKAVSHGDQDDNFMEDFDLEALSSHLSWEEDSLSSASRWGRNSESEKVPPARQSLPSPASEEPQMDLETDFPVAERFDHGGQKKRTPASTKSKPRKKSREARSPKKRARKRSEASSPSKAAVQHGSTLHNEYGVQAWKSWIRWRNTQPNVEISKLASRNLTLKEDLLQCSTAELSYGLCRFVTDVRRPNGDPYSPDSIYYLCLGIQQFLFENGRMENIFADLFYAKFSQTMSDLLKDWKPTILPSGYVHSRVEEEYLWECKQLGAFSPSVLLNTLLYFCTKFFSFKTVSQHRRLSFAHIMRCSRTNSSGNKRSCLRFYPPVHKETKSTSKSSPDSSAPAKRKRVEDEEDEDGAVLEMKENSDNPLRCPVRLYEFYLSKCSSSVKQRTNVFFLRPERSCVPNSPLWFSSMSLDDAELESMLTRILAVREIHLEREKPANLSESEAQTDSD